LKRADHPVAWAVVVNAFADLDDFGGGVAARHQTGLGVAHVAAEWDRYVAVVQRDRFYPQQHFSSLW